MSQLLKAKLYSPPTRPELVTRERLFVHLDGVLQRKLALLSAPAGFGKTTLLSAWLHVRNLGARAAWLSLDERDSDPRRFWSYVTGALQTVDANAGAGILDALAAPNPPAFPELLTELINDLEALPNTLLILDDYHLIQAAPVHDSLAFFLDYLPKPLHLVIASRTNPPLPLSRLRGRGQLVELRQADLQFTREETERFLNQIMDLHLPPDIIDKLRNRTEGWVTGLQMAALSLRGRDDAADFVADFAGTHRYILDYLVEEVLERESAKVQRFLLRTAILERLCAPLCDAVLAGGPEEEIIHSSSQEMLAYLDRAHLFVVPLDDQRQWYRYHRLFADLLRARAALQEEARLPLLHRRASVWYEQAG
ncbi:MAG: hypothetical protein JXB35_05340, partial [Anaerolineae bacterium]|nr:hypothetical protein [Anaerolineae bacterium]